MTLRCECGSPALEFTAQSYSEDGSAFEAYRCADCGRTGSLDYDATLDHQELRGCLVIKHETRL